MQRHIRLNVPFHGKVAYKTREYSYDNYTTELIRHTIELIKTTEFGSAILEWDATTKDSVSAINQVTTNYHRGDRSYIISKNLNAKANPFYADYLPLRQLCLQILRYEEISFSGVSEGLYGILFDGAWLWEEYLATVLESCGFTHPRNKDSFGALRVYAGNPRYPDFYKGEQLPKETEIDTLNKKSESNFVLDAKYKKLNKNGDADSDEISAHFSRDDLHQLITYMHILPAKKGGLIYPLAREETSEKKIVESEPKTLFGFGGCVSTFGIPIPAADSYKGFCQAMKEIEADLRCRFGN